MIAFTKYDAGRSEIGEIQRDSDSAWLFLCRRQIMFHHFRQESDERE